MMDSEADVVARAHRKMVEDGPQEDAPLRPPPTVDAEWLARQMGRRGLTAADVARIVQVTPMAVSYWLEGRTISAKRQRELMDVFGEPLNLHDATLDELMREVVRRFRSPLTL